MKMITPVSRNLDAERSFEDIATLESMRMRVEQTTLTSLLVLISTFVVYFVLRGRVNPIGFNIWAGLILGGTAVRAILCRVLRRRIDTASRSNLKRYEYYLFASAVLNAVAIGCSYWLVARTGEL